MIFVGKHTTMKVSTDFDIEPVLELFRAEYGDDPEVEVPTVIFKSLDERVAGDRAYILLFKLRTSKGSKAGFIGFLKAYCVLHKKTAIGTSNGIFPSVVDPRGFHVINMPDNKRK